MEKSLPSIPAKRYFTIGEVGDLCGVKPHVLRYWEQEFTQLRPMKRRGNRRYYQHHEVLMIRRIRELLYDQGFTISGARNKLQEMAQAERDRRRADDGDGDGDLDTVVLGEEQDKLEESIDVVPVETASQGLGQGLCSGVRRELLEIRELLSFHG